MTLADRLRPPPLLDLRAPAYKDWLHVNLFDFAAGRVGLFNVSLHGDPADTRSLAAAAVVVADLDGEMHAAVEVTDLAAATTTATSVRVGDTLTMAFQPDGVAVAARLPGGGEVDVVAHPGPGEIAVEAPIPFGSGWIAWRALPRCRVSGQVTSGGEQADLTRVAAYHDHNWGRWHWGDDAGWEWAALLGEDGTTLVLSHTTDRSHRLGRPRLHLAHPDRARRFPPGAVTVRREGRFGGDLVRRPGAMAALHSGRMRPHLPARLVISADDGLDRLEATLEVVHACQLITADPVVPGYGFIHELLGRFRCRGRIEGTEIDSAGLGVFEHVD